MYKSLKTLFLVFVALLAFTPKAYADDACSNLNDQPVIYQITRTPTTATLYFPPLASNFIQNYTVMYGFKAEDERYSLTINQGLSTGAIAHTINDLQPGVQYFYKVMGNTSCTSSPWSAWTGDIAVTEGSQIITPLSAIPVTGPEITIGMTAASLLMIVTGFGLYAFSKRRI